MIISLNGLDDCGKTTQIKNITKKYGDTWFAYSTIKLSREIECLSPCCFNGGSILQNAKNSAMKYILR